MIIENEKSEDAFSELHESEATYSTGVFDEQKSGGMPEDRLKRLWPHLSEEQKENVVSIAQQFVEAEHAVHISEEEWTLIMNKRESYINGTAKTYTWDELKDILISKQKRDELLNRR